MDVYDSGMVSLPFLPSLMRCEDFGGACLPCSYYLLSHGAVEHMPPFGLRCAGLQDYYPKHPVPVGSQKGGD